MTIEPARMRRSFALWPVLIAALGLSGCAAMEEIAPPPTPAALIDTGDQAARRGDFEHALTYYLRAVAAEETPEAWFRVGAAADELGNTERALFAYLQVIDLDATHAGAQEGAGLAYMALNDSEAAEEHLRQAVALEPRSWRSQNALGILADRAENFDEAQQHYDAALKINPNSPMLVNNLGYSHYLAGDLDQAARDFYRATELSPDYSAAWVNLSRVYADQSWYDDAITMLERVSDKAKAYTDVGTMAYENGDLGESEKLLTEAIRISPTYLPAANRTLDLVRSKLVDPQQETQELDRLEAAR